MYEDMIIKINSDYAVVRTNWSNKSILKLVNKFLNKEFTSLYDLKNNCIDFELAYKYLNATLKTGETIYIDKLVVEG